MEKFAVDLEKVLDEFEYSEEQLNEYSPEQAVINEPFDYKIFPHTYRPAPTSEYRRPSFEPMNLADADFSISPRLVNNTPIVTSTTAAGTIGTSNGDEAISTANLDYSLLRAAVKGKDFKPDLIECNADILAPLDKLTRSDRYLPDVTSAKSSDACFDLIKNSNVSAAAAAAAEVAEEEEEIRRRRIVQFPVSNDDICDSTLKQYLEELEEKEEHKMDESETPSSALQTADTSKEENSADVSDDYSYNAINDTDDKSEKSENDTEYSISEQYDLPKRSSYSADEVTGRKYRILSENMPLISSSVDSQECDSSEDKPTDANKVYAETESDSILEHSLTDSNSSGKQAEETENVGTSAAAAAVAAIPKEHVEAEALVDGDGTECEPLSIMSEKLSELSSNVVDVVVEGDAAEQNVDHFSEMEYTDSSTAENVTEVSDVVLGEKCAVVAATISDSFNEGVDAESRPDLENYLAASSSANDLDVSVSSGSTSSQYNAVVSESGAAATLLESEYEASLSDVMSQAPHESHYPTGSTDTQYGETVNQQASTSAESQLKLQRPDSLNLTHTTQTSEMSSTTSADSGSLLSAEEQRLGKEAPFWMPDKETTVCMHCQMKFTIVKRRHHCRACGLVLCSKCCDMKASLEYRGYEEARVCHNCYSILQRINSIDSEGSTMRRPNPNNPMEYCSTIPPLLQVGPTQPPPPSVLVPVVGVLKREGRAKTNDPPKQVIFSDGIRPGGDLTELDVPSEPRLLLRRSARVTKRVGGTAAGNVAAQHRRLLNPDTRSFIPSSGSDLPPMVLRSQGEYLFSELVKPLNVDDESVRFAINRNLFVLVKRIVLDCCVHKEVWCCTTEGFACVGQDEIVFVLEVLPEEKYPPKDVFLTVNLLYQEASKGATVTEMSFASPCLNQLFGTKDHGGFVFIRPTSQCIQKLLLPKAPFLVALLIHRWETPWARLFPVRLVLRLGAEYRYYPCPLVSIRNRTAVFSEIGHTIIRLLADFRKYSYSLPTVRGLVIHIEDRLTTILLPKNRYDQVIRAMNNSEENVLAFAGNISTVADSHLICIQSVQQDDTSYDTQAINILNKPRQITGASFIVFNGSLKQCDWSGKSNIVEDGLMVQIPSESMVALRAALRQMKDYSIGCGPQAEEMVVLKWAPDDLNFNIGVKSEIDNQPFDGVPSIRVHNGIDYSGTSRLIRWTEVFILQSDEDAPGNKTGDTVNISKLAESIARATCVALVPLLDLLTTANLTTLAVRATIHTENVGYEAGSRGEKLPPLYMKSLDEQLIVVVHQAAVSIGDISNPVILELVFRIMEQG